MTERVEPPQIADERTMLSSWLDFHRATVGLKVGGLSDEEARRQLVRSQLTTCAGLVRHLRYVERWWFQEILEGLDMPAPEPRDETDAEFVVGPDLSLGQLLDEYEQECARSRQVMARHQLDDVSMSPRRRVSYRWILVHMIEETSRHNGHLDILRELIDGQTGE
jgi:uncharacterized damage-inducible protein DinB